jgi:KUP system potassium uptake protein
VTQSTTTNGARPANSAPNAAAGGFTWRKAGLVLGALGVVYGDIGTSPLYTVRVSVLAASGPAPGPDAITGVISLIFWALTIVVTVKYICFVMRADNKGEGGIVALSALAHRAAGLKRWAKTAVGVAGVVGLSLFFGEALLTPSITVLGALEGLRVEEPGLQPWVVPLTLVVLVGLFMLQSRGTGSIGRMFGPIMLVWFIAIGGLGLRAILLEPSILWAVNPLEAVNLFLAEPGMAFIALGSIVLAVTGVEALYADMGHFGRQPIRIAWLFIAMPALMLNYFGQGAAILHDVRALDHPFFALAQGPLHYPLVALATIAAMIASQAVISGIFSITQQAVQLGQLPRMEIRHTSATEAGQIFIPRVNAIMLIGVITIVLMFENADSLAAAYGIAVTGVMVISTMLVATVARNKWGWPLWLIIAVFGLFATVDLAFFSANILYKLFEGGWLPVAIALSVLFVMDTWRMGRKAFVEKTHGTGLATGLFLERADKTPTRVSGTAIYFSPRLDDIPGALLHNLKHNQVLHERIILLNVVVEDTPFAAAEKRLEVRRLGKGFHEVVVHFGFFEDPDVPKALEGARALGLAIDIDNTSFFIRRETLVKAQKSSLRPWRAKLFMMLQGTAQEAARFYRLPPGRVVELGAQIEF